MRLQTRCKTPGNSQRRTQATQNLWRYTWWLTGMLFLLRSYRPLGQRCCTSNQNNSSTRNIYHNFSNHWLCQKERHRNESIFLEEKVVKDIMKRCLSPKHVANPNNMESGLSVVAFLKRTNDEIIEMKQDETSRAESIQTCNQWEFKQNQRKKPRTPPTTFDETLGLMATYVMAIKALFGKCCSHFEQVIKLRKTLSALWREQKSYPPQHM